MNDMVAFCTAILDAVVVFLATPPVFYLFSLVCFGAIISVVLRLIK